jgi:methanogenic corrinoid protein MtbC1
MSDPYDGLVKAINHGEVDSGVSEALGLLEGGVTPIEIFNQCIEPCLAVIGNKFSKLEIFLPEMINSAEVVKAIQEAIKPYLKAEDAALTRGRIVIATVSGDLHDIGKNIVKAMLEVNGYEVKDLGVDVSPQTILSGAKEFEAQIIALSALMLPSLPFVKDVVDFVQAGKKTRTQFKVIVGGGPVSLEWAEEAGTDGYGDDAVEAVEVVQQLLGV